MSSDKKSLKVEDISIERAVSRRSALGLIGAGAVGAAVTVVGVAGSVSHAEAQSSGCSDSDPRDAAGNGRCCRGITDSDPSDGVGCGRHTCSDSDPSDPAGRGHRC